MITIVDYQIGNLTSIQNMLKKNGFESIIATDIEQIEKGEKFILPGVGSFEYGIEKLRSMDYFDLFEKKILHEKKTILGVCLGAQLLFEESEEGNSPKGLGWLKGRVIKFKPESMGIIEKIPHMGWNNIEPQKPSKLLSGLEIENRFYFVHSYHILCDNKSDELSRTNYGYSFVSGVERGNILGVQFHPEKSHRFGMQLYRNFANNYK